MDGLPLALAQANSAAVELAFAKAISALGGTNATSGAALLAPSAVRLLSLSPEARRRRLQAAAMPAASGTVAVIAAFAPPEAQSALAGTLQGGLASSPSTLLAALAQSVGLPPGSLVLRPAVVELPAAPAGATTGAPTLAVAAGAGAGGGLLLLVAVAVMYAKRQAASARAAAITRKPSTPRSRAVDPEAAAGSFKGSNPIFGRGAAAADTPQRALGRGRAGSKSRVGRGAGGAAAAAEEPDFLAMSFEELANCDELFYFMNGAGLLNDDGAPSGVALPVVVDRALAQKYPSKAVRRLAQLGCIRLSTERMGFSPQAQQRNGGARR